MVHCSYPATAQCNHNTLIYHLQEAAPKTPRKCIHPGPCIELAKAQNVCEVQEAVLKLYFCGCVLFIDLTLIDPSTGKSTISPTPNSQALLVSIQQI